MDDSRVIQIKSKVGVRNIIVKNNQITIHDIEKNFGVGILTYRIDNDIKSFYESSLKEEKKLEEVQLDNSNIQEASKVSSYTNSSIDGKSESSVEFPDATMLKSGIVVKFLEKSHTNKYYLETVPYSDLNVQIMKKLGRGGQGQVRPGNLRETPIAVKSIPKDVFSRSAHREISLLAFLRHPKIVTVLVQSETEDEIHIAMEHFEGCSLYKLLFVPKIKSKNPLSIHAKNKIVLQITEALAYCHAIKPHPIIHRDIKPSNILVQAESSNCLTKVCDFGLGVCKDLRKSLQSTIAKGTIGTQGYMAPEIALHQLPATTSSDVWSYGCTVAEIYSESPVWGSNDYSGLMKMCKGETPDISKVPLNLKEKIKLCFSYNPSQRPSMQEILKLFEKKN